MSSEIKRALLPIGVEAEGRTVLVDSRESTELADRLRRKFADIRPVKHIQLKSGDIVCGQLAVERKTADDLLGSTFGVGKRIWQQIYELRANFADPYVVVVGDVKDALLKHSQPQRMWYAWLGAQLRIVRSMRVPTLWVDSDTQLVWLIDKMLQEREPGQRPIEIAKKARNHRDIQSDILCAVDLVGRKVADKLLDQFGTLRSVASAPLPKLQEVDGVGKEVALRVYEAFQT